MRVISGKFYENEVFFVTPYLEHEKFTDYFTTLTIEEIKIYLYQLLNCLDSIHSLDLIHRDIKPDNFLYNPKTKKCLLIDFGLSDVLERPENFKEDEDLKTVFDIQRTYNLKNRIGTRGFMAPETIFNYSYQGKGVDVWAAGVIFLSFISKKFPVLNMNKFSKINNEVIKEIYPLACIFGKEKIEMIAKKYSKKITIFFSKICFLFSYFHIEIYLLFYFSLYYFS